MKKMTLVGRCLTGAVALTLLVTGCKKTENGASALSPQEEEQATMFTTESETDSQFAFDDVLDNVLGVNSEVGVGGGGVFGRTTGNAGTEKIDSASRCVTVTISPAQTNAFPKTVTMDFGTGCESHGHLRSGKIVTVYSGRLIEPGKSATTTFDNFRIDSMKVEGTHKITNTTTAGNNQRQFKIETIAGKLTHPNGNYEEWNATRIHTQIEGNGTAGPADDIVRITGNSSGATKRSNRSFAWTSEITEPLIKAFSCRWISKGTIKATRNGASSVQWAGVLNFGDGTCDNKATLTVNGHVHQIVLR